MIKDIFFVKLSMVRVRRNKGADPSGPPRPEVRSCASQVHPTLPTFYVYVCCLPAARAIDYKSVGDQLQKYSYATGREN